MKTMTKTLTNGLPAIHPNEFLYEILDELGLTQAAFAQVIGVSPCVCRTCSRTSAPSLLSLPCAWVAHSIKRRSIGSICKRHTT